MKVTPSPLTAAARVLGPLRLMRIERIAAAVAVVSVALGLGLSGQASADTAAAASTDSAANLRVGHTVKQITVSGSLPGEQRQVDVHLWYPADQQGLSDRPTTVYRSALWGRCSSTASSTATPCPPAPPGIQLPWTPLSWEVEAEVARENAPIDPHGHAFPVIVFSHGSTNDPIDYAHTLELIAGAGFVVAAPYHVNNTQDDARIDYINQLAGRRLFDCRDGLPPRPIAPGKADCSKSDVPSNMADRVRDINYVLDDLPVWFGDRVDVSRAGVIGHSRGTVTALAAAGGTAEWSCGPTASPSCPHPLNCVQPKPSGDHPRCWPDVEPDNRVQAVMGMAIGAEPITFGANLAEVRVPALLVAGGRDQNPSLPRPAIKVSEAAFAAISGPDKLLVEIPNATHRSFDSTYCAQLQSAAAHAKIDPNALLDAHTVGLIAASAPGFMSGKAVHYCAPRFFTSPPVNIQHVVASTPNAEYFCSDTEDPNLGNELDPACGLTAPVAGPPSPCVTTSIPCTGLDTDEVKQGITQIAVAFFDSALRRTDDHGIDFKRYLAPKWLIKHVPMVGSAQAYAGPGSICPPGQGVICADQ